MLIKKCNLINLGSIMFHYVMLFLRDRVASVHNDGTQADKSAWKRRRGWRKGLPQLSPSADWLKLTEDERLSDWARHMKVADRSIGLTHQHWLRCNQSEQHFTERGEKQKILLPKTFNKCKTLKDSVSQLWGRTVRSAQAAGRKPADLWGNTWVVLLLQYTSELRTFTCNGVFLHCCIGTFT